MISKRRAAGMGEEAPAGTEVTGAVSPAVEGASPAAPEVTAAPEATGATAADDAEARATAAKRPD